MQLIDVSTHARDPKYYNRDRDMETALAWNAIRKTLTRLGRDDLFGYIQSVRLTEKSVIVTTNKPIINAELKLYRNELLQSINSSLQSFSPITRQQIKAL